MESETALFFDPEAQLCRTQILDYFAYWNRTLRPANVLFRFEATMELGSAERQLLDQVCLASAFDRASIPQYLLGIVTLTLVIAFALAVTEPE